MFLTSCVKDFEEIELSKQTNQAKEKNKDDFSRKFSGDSVVLNNPYSINNMGKALAQIKGNYTYENFPDVDNFQIQTSHYYIKFKPRNEQEEGLLKKDSTLHLFDYRLDCEYKEEYLKNRLPSNDSIPDYYTSVPVNYTMPNVPYEVIDELYIPEQDSFFDDVVDIEEYQIKRDISNKTDFFNHLLWEAFLYTGNEKEMETKNSSESQRWVFGSKWYPSGIVYAYDDIKQNLIPVGGAQVLMRQWFTVRNAITWANGAFTTGFVRGHARYVIQWERYHYSIRNGAFFQAETQGPSTNRDPWFAFLWNGDNKYHAHIHQAAHDYYYGGRFWLTSPPLNDASRIQMKIAAREIGNTSSYSHIRTELTFGIAPQISIKQYGSLSDKVYGVTIHELAHAAHQNFDAASYNNMVRDAHFSPLLPREVRLSNERVIETWARTVETYMTLFRYRNWLAMPNYDYNFSVDNQGQYNSLINFQKLTINQTNTYTSCGIDMIDDINQRVKFNNFGLPVDNVNGYSIKQVELGLYGAQSWLQWRNNMMTRYSNNDDAELIELFNNWN